MSKSKTTSIFTLCNPWSEIDIMLSARIDRRFKLGDNATMKVEKLAKST
jgi:hypothetical protein